MPFTVFNGDFEGFLIVLCLMLAYLAILLGAWYGYYRKKTAQQPFMQAEKKT